MAIFSKKQSDAPRRRRAEIIQQRATESSLEDRYTFRRNRTLTGSASSKVISTNESNAHLKSPRVHAHDLVRKRRHVGMILVLVILGSVLLYSLIAQFTAGVVVRERDITMQLDPTYEKTIQDYLDRQPTQRLRFLLNMSDLSDYLQAAAPEVASVSLDGSAGFGKTAFILTMRTPIAGWSVNGRQQYVDATGTSFARNYFSTPSVQIVDNSGAHVAAGQAVASNRFLGFVGRVVGLTKARGYTVNQVVIPEGTTRQVELHLDKLAYPIKFSVDRTAGEQVEDMDRSIKWLSDRHITPQYIDVRISGKAFYR